MKRLLGVVCVVVLACCALDAAPLSGRVVFVTKRGQSPVAEETLVWVEPGSARAPRRAPQSLRMTTRGKMLIPHVMAIPVGSTVSFPNEDPISHNLFSLTSGNQFDLGLYRTGAGKSHTFTVPGIVNVYCNVHPGMSAVIHVLSSPWYAFADAAGNFSIPDVPAGRWNVVAWNEQGGTTTSTVEVGGTASPLVLTLDSRGYRAGGHTNKFGRNYDPPRSREY